MDSYTLELETEADTEEEAIENFQQRLYDMSADPDDIQISMTKANKAGGKQ